MIGEPLPLSTGEEAARLIRALGRHRYVASRLHLVHVLVYAAATADGDAAPGEFGNDDLREGAEWAKRALAGVAHGAIDLASRDERLWRKATEAEVAALLEIYWSAHGADARARLEESLTAIGATLEGMPFDEAGEDAMFPVLIDCGWELLPLGALDAARHKGAIDSFGTPLDFEVARFQEDAAKEGGQPPAYLHELSALGPIELLYAFDDETGALAEPLVLWSEGPEPYLDYLLRGALKSAKLA